MLETLPLHHLTRVVSLLAQGNIVAYPTGTSYGLGVNALETAALQRLSDLKQRREDKAYTVILPTAQPERFVDWTKAERQVFLTLQHRPLTLLVRAKALLAHLAHEGLVGIRSTDHPFTRELAALLPFPITATSANPSGQRAACAPDDLGELAKQVRITVVDGGRLAPCLPSTVAEARDDGNWRITRKGDVSVRELERATQGNQTWDTRRPGLEPQRARPPLERREDRLDVVV